MNARLVERSEELRAMASAARAADQGHGSLVLISGEPGVGKAALVRALHASVPAGARVLTGYCDALSGTGRPARPNSVIGEPA